MKKMFVVVEVEDCPEKNKWVRPIDYPNIAEWVLKSRVIYADKMREWPNAEPNKIFELEGVSPKLKDEWEEYDMQSPWEHLTNSTMQKVWLRKMPREKP